MIKRFRSLYGPSGLQSAGAERVWRGLRSGERRDLLFGSALLAIAWLRRSEPKKELLFRKEVPVGSAILIHHTRKGDPKIEVIKPSRRSG